MLLTSIPLLALLALPAALASTSRKCDALGSPPADRICGPLGRTSNKDGKFEYAYETASAAECADVCLALRVLGCQTFSYAIDGTCQLYANSMERLTFTAENTGDVVPWYDMRCFECVDRDTIIYKDDFDSLNVNSWVVSSDDYSEWYADVQRVKHINGQTLDSMRIVEATTTGLIDYDSTTFSLERGANYEMSFWGRVDPRGAAWAEDDFSSMEIGIANSAEDVFRYTPTGAMPLGGGWYRWDWPFTVERGQDGTSFVSIRARASGNEMDWYLSQIRVEKINA